MKVGTVRMIGALRWFFAQKVLNSFSYAEMRRNPEKDSRGCDTHVYKVLNILASKHPLTQRDPPLNWVRLRHLLDGLSFGELTAPNLVPINKVAFGDGALQDRLDRLHVQSHQSCLAVTVENRPV